ncbi:hypothetical protein D3C73_1253040 [compost metagenome]
MLAGNFDSCAFDKLNNPCRSTRQQAIIANNQITYVYRVKSIYIFFNGNGINNRFFVNVLRQRKLYQNSMNTLLIVQLVH